MPENKLFRANLAGAWIGDTLGEALDEPDPFTVEFDGILESIEANDIEDHQKILLQRAPWSQRLFMEFRKQV